MYQECRGAKKQAMREIIAGRQNYQKYNAQPARHSLSQQAGCTRDYFNLPKTYGVVAPPPAPLSLPAGAAGALLVAPPVVPLLALLLLVLL